MTTLPWLTGLMRESGFVESGRVIAFTRPVARMPAEDAPSDTSRPMEAGDLPQVEEVDHSAFADPWRMDREELQATFERSVLALVQQTGDRIGGYALASHTPRGVHITRLAVRPADQGQGIGRGLVLRLLHELALRGSPPVSVNTQIDNLRSQRLYGSLGFAGPGESYPVFRYAMPRSAKDRERDPE
jgi:ribosomal protein S18 acetylase RimI-like enzyme